MQVTQFNTCAGE